MRAGSLRYVLIFKELRTIKSSTGAVSKEYIPVYKCRADKLKFTNATDKDNIEAKEEFYGHFGVFKVRFSPKINDMQIVEFRGVDYKILLIDPVGSDCLINVNKINK